MSDWLKKCFLILLFGGLAAGMPAVALADDDGHAGEHMEEHHEDEEHHEHEGQHGGYIGDANDIYHFEMILEPGGMFKVYLYDGSLEPLSVSGVEARWTLAPGNEYPLTGKFNREPEGAYYWVKFPPHESDVVHLKIEARKNGEWVPLEYYLPAGKHAGED